MMGLGYLGNNGGPSSSSNLSPLAPPFTVDRSNPKSNSNPLNNFTEPSPPYGVLPFSSSLHSWQYPHISAASRPDFFSNCESEIDSIHTAPLTSANDYCYLGSDSVNPPSAQWAPSNPSVSNPTNPFSYLGAPKQFYSPYVPQAVDDGTSLVGLGDANYDLLSNSGLVPMVHGSSQVDYTQDLSSAEFPLPWGGYWNGLAEGKQGKTAESDRNFRVDERDVSDSFVYKDYIKQGCLGRCEENSDTSQRKYDDVSGREYPYGSLSQKQLDDNFLVQNLGFMPIESSKSHNLGTATMSTESHLESPSLEQMTFSSKRFQLFDSGINDCVSVTKSSPSLVTRPPTFGTKPSKSMDIGNQSIEKLPYPPPILEGKEGFLDTSHLSFHVFATSSSTKEELSNKPRIGAQVPDINVPHGFSFTGDSSESFKLAANSPAEDSPCWKGAPASHASPFETSHAMPPQNLLKKLEECDGLNFQGTPMFTPPNDSVKDLSREVCETSLQKEAPLSPNRIFTANLPAKGKSDGVDLNRSDGVQFSDNVGNPIKEYYLPCGSEIDYGEAAVKPHRPVESCPKVNVQMLVKSMHNLSELLVFHCLNDSCTLKYQDFKALEHAMSNIDACMLKKIVQSAPPQESMFPGEGTSLILEEGANRVRPRPRNEVGTSSIGQLISQGTHEQRGKCDASGKKFEKNMDFCSLRNDSDVTTHHNLVQDIRKALDKNFQLEEKMPSEILLYKNLWLDAEAELCSVAFRARFDRVKIQMENNCKSDKAKENNVAVEKFPSSKVSPDPNNTHMLIPESNNDSPKLKTSILNSISSPKSQHVDDVEASVMARFHILKGRGDNSNTSSVEEKHLPKIVDVGFSGMRNHCPISKIQTENNHMLIPESTDDSPKQKTSIQNSSISGPKSHFDDVEDSVMARFQMLKGRSDNSNASNVEDEKLPEVVDIGFSDKTDLWPIVENKTENKSSDVAVGSAIQPDSGHNNEGNGGSYYLDHEIGEDNFDPSYLDHEIVGDNGGSSYLDHEAVKEFQPCRNNKLQNLLALGSGWYDNSSSDWEHVLKDDFAWKK